jgi:ComF family protein
MGLMHAAAQSLFATLFPSDCRLCGAPLTEISRLPVCPACLEALPHLEGAHCELCGEAMPADAFIAGSQPDARVLCGMCRRVVPPYERALAYGPYDGGLRELIHLFKYDHVRPAANVLGRMLAEVVAELLENEMPPSPLVVPVPLYKGKRRERGFNQAEDVARIALKQPVLLAKEDLVLAHDALARIRETRSQTGLTRHQRRENVRGAFAVPDSATVRDRNLVLVDDVFTTGTTVAECARVLKRAGARTVLVATIARVLRTEPTVVPKAREGKEMTFAAHA